MEQIARAGPGLDRPLTPASRVARPRFVDGEIGPLIHFSPDRSRQQAYVRPFGGISYVTDGETVFRLGGGLGVRIPVAERLATRLEASYAHGLTDFGGGDILTLRLGISYFAR